MNQFQEKFIEEARELIQGLESKIIGQDLINCGRPTIDEIFRVMHTLKGTASMFGFDSIEQITHHLETVYDQIREGTRKISTEIIDCTFNAIDFISLILDKFNELDDTDEGALRNLIREIVAISGTQEDVEGDEKEGIDRVKDKKGFFIYFVPHEDIYLRGIKPQNVFDEIEEIGKYKTIPYFDRVPDLNTYNSSKFYVYWDIFLVTEASKDEVEDVFLFFDSSDYQIYEFDLCNLSEEDFAKAYAEITKKQLSEEGIENVLSLAEGCQKANIGKPDSLKQQSVTLKNDEINADFDISKEIKSKSASIKVSADKLDDLIVNVSEFVTLYSQISLLSKNNSDDRLNKALQNLGKLSKKLRDNALDLRLVPLKDISLKLNRLVRDLSKKLDKKIKFVTEGLDTELDKTIIDNLEEPLLHIIRNSIDHGIEDKESRMQANKPEEGIVKLTAFYSGNSVFIQVQDDGKGIAKDVIKNKAIEKGLINKNAELSEKDIYDLIFEPGFSTAQTVSKVSGRGVGMDVVRSKINELRGEIEIDSELGLGTSISIKLPLALSIIDTLKIQIGKNVYLIPISAVDSCISVDYSSLISATKKQYEYQGEFIPVVTLRDEFNLMSDVPKKGKVVIVQHYEKRYCLLVDKILGDHQAVIKPLDHLNKEHAFFSGVSVMGDGSLALIIDTGKILTSNKEMYNFK